MRRALVILLAVGMAVLSFDALRAYALTGQPLVDGVIPQATILPRPYLAMLWALVIDISVAAGILGVKDDRRDWRAWLMLLLALAATLGFQVFALSPFVARAVPPVGLALAILVLDLGPARPRPERASGPPAPARLHAWLRSWDLPETQRPLAPVAQLPTARPAPVPGVRSHRQQAATPAPPRARGDLTPGQRARVEAMIAEGQRSIRAMAREIGLDHGAGRQRVARLIDELQAAPVGGPGQNGQGDVRE